MSRGVSNKITYKPYSQNEQWLLPPSLDELVPENHFARIVRKTVDELTPKIKAVPNDMAVSIKGPAIKKGNFPAPRVINGDSLADME